MSTENAHPPTRLQSECRRLAQAIVIAAPLLLCLIVLDRTGPLVANLVTGKGQVSWQAGALAIINLTPPLIYLTSLWRTGAALRDIGRAGRFVAAVSVTLRDVGLALILGAAFQIIISPALSKALGHNIGYWIGLDSAAITLGVIGLVLMTVARLFRRAARLENELDEII